LLLAKGYSLKQVQEWLGHSNYSTTANFYGHVNMEQKRDMVNAMGTSLHAKTL